MDPAILHEHRGMMFLGAMLYSKGCIVGTLDKEMRGRDLKRACQKFINTKFKLRINYIRN